MNSKNGLANELKNIMYVDDDMDLRNIVEFALEDEPDFQLMLCSSGHQAIDKVSDFEPDIIMLDVMMPGMDGPTTLQKLRELPQTRTTPVIFITAKVQPKEVEHFKSIGAVDVISKPFEVMEIADRIRRNLYS